MYTAFIFKVFLIAAIKGMYITAEIKTGPQPGTGRIVGGRLTEIAKHPYMVSLQFGFQRPTHKCGGTLLNSLWVLTAAHCVVELPTSIVKDPKLWTVVAGSTNTNFTDGNFSRATQSRRVLAFFPHRRFLQSVSTYDIALVRLEKPIEESANIKFVKLGRKKSQGLNVVEPCITTGWGLTSRPDMSSSSVSHILKEVGLELLSTWQCQLSYGRHYILEEMSLCTVGTSEATCQGDSGGPLMCGSKGLEQEGIVSWSRIGCGTANPTVFTRVDNFLDWIDKYTVEENVLSGIRKQRKC